MVTCVAESRRRTKFICGILVIMNRGKWEGQNFYFKYSILINYLKVLFIHTMYFDQAHSDYSILPNFLSIHWIVTNLPTVIFLKKLTLLPPSTTVNSFTAGNGDLYSMLLSLEQVFIR